jgi:hypothetical protein
MIELYELRVSEKYANRIFREDEGEVLSSGITRKVLIASDDPRIPRIIEFHDSMRRENHLFLGGTRVVRKYTTAEMKSVEILAFMIGFFIEPAGEECGTIYDDASACTMCGAGARQVTELYLKRSRIPRSRDVTGTIAQVELVASQRFFDFVKQHQFSGVDLPTVLSPVQLKRRTNISAKFEDWYQLVVTSNRVNMVPPTRIGRVPFGELKPKCPLGHFTGLWPISEVSLNRADWDGADVFQSKQLIGIRGGLLRPFPVLFVTQRFYQVFKSQRLRGGRFEVAHFV